MKTRHTPGPWMAYGPALPTTDSPEGGDYCVMDGGTNVIAEAFYRVSEGVGGTHNAEANARLIAAAPLMLEALQDVLREFVDPNQGLDQFDSAIVRKAVERARAAIAAATGEQP